MWTGEIRKWTIQGGELNGRIYNSKNCRWANWEYADGTYISIPIYHWPESSKEDDTEYRLTNWMHATLGAKWYWDLMQNNPWVPCPLHFKLVLDDNKEPDEWYLYQSGCMVCEYPWGRKLLWKDDMTITEDPEEPKEAEIVPLPKLSVITGGRDNTGNWLINLQEGSVFLCRLRTKDNKDKDIDFLLLQFHVKKKWRMGVWLHSNFPFNQAGDFIVHSLSFSQKHELVELLQDGEPEGDDDGVRRQDED